jgi:hypothetical protein
MAKTVNDKKKVNKKKNSPNKVNLLLVIVTSNTQNNSHSRFYNRTFHSCLKLEGR